MFFAIIFNRQRLYHGSCGKDKTPQPGIAYLILAKRPASSTICGSGNRHGAINFEVFFDSLQFIVIIKDNLQKIMLKLRHFSNSNFTKQSPCIVSPASAMTHTLIEKNNTRCTLHIISNWASNCVDSNKRDDSVKTPAKRAPVTIE